MSRRFNSCRGPLLRSLLIILFVVALAAVAAYQSRLNYEQQARTSAANLSRVLGDHIVGALGKIDLSLSTIVVEALPQYDKGRIDPWNLNRLLAQQTLLLPDVSGLVATDSAGIVRYGPTEFTKLNADLSDRDYFRQLRDDPRAGLVVGGPYRSRVTSEWGMVFARRISRPDGSFAGVVAGLVDTKHFGEMLMALDLGRNGMASLRTADLTLVARFPGLESFGNDLGKAVSDEYQAMVRQNPYQGIFAARNPADRIYRTIAYRKLDGFPLYIAVGLAPEDYLAPWWSEVMQLAALVAVFSLAILWISRDGIRAARKLHATNQLLREAVENSAVGFSIFDADQRLVACNETVRGFFPELHHVLKPGNRLEYILQTGVLRGQYPGAEKDPAGWVGERLRRHRAADGQPFELTLGDGRQLLIIDNRAPSGHVVTNRIDVTELTQYRRQLERLVETRTEELQAALDQFRILVELSPTALAMLDEDLRYLAASRRWIEMFGGGRTHVLGEPMYDVTPDFPEHWQAAHRAALAGVMDSRDEDRWIQADGSERWVRWAVCPWAGGSRCGGGIVVSMEDITDRKLAEQQLLEREAQYRATFEQAGVGVCHATLEGEFFRVNDKFCSILGYGREELLGLRYQDITYPDDLNGGAGGTVGLVAGEIASISREKRYVRKDGKVIWVNVTVALVRKGDGEPNYSLAVVEDIQQRKEAEAALALERKARQFLLEQEVARRTAELRAANQQLEGFVYASSHDLRGPLGRISSFSTLLEKNYRDRLEGDGLLFLDFIRDNALRLTRLIDDLLSHAQVDQRVTDLQPIDLQSAARAVLEEMAEDIREQGAVVRLALPRVQVMADSYGLSQVFRNLLENALKYSSEAAEPTIEIGGSDGDGLFRLWVRDNGIGFDMEYQDKIFEIFRRLHTHAEYTGSGVGLALVKRAMERMGGKVWAEGEPGKGATFYLEFQTAAELVDA